MWERVDRFNRTMGRDNDFKRLVRRRFLKSNMASPLPDNNPSRPAESPGLPDGNPSWEPSSYCDLDHLCFGRKIHIVLDGLDIERDRLHDIGENFLACVTLADTAGQRRYDRV